MREQINFLGTSRGGGAKDDQIIKYSKVPIIRTGTYASSAVHTMYCQNCPMFGTYNRSFRVSSVKKVKYKMR